MKMLLDRWAVDNVGSFPNGQTRRSQRMRAKFITPIIFGLPCTEIKFWLSNWIKRNNQIVQLNSKKIHDPQSIYITDPTHHMNKSKICGRQVTICSVPSMLSTFCCELHLSSVSIFIWNVSIWWWLVSYVLLTWTINVVILFFFFLIWNE